MTKTEQMLLEVHKSPALPLEDICDAYFNLNPHSARVAANAHALGVPTFRLRESNKAPFMVHLSDLAEYIDTRAAQSRAEWATSQV